MIRFAGITILCVFSALSARAETAPDAPSPAIEAGNICRMAIEVAEINNKIPRELLQAVALNESGKWNEKEKSLIAWPWTLTVEGTGHYYDSYAQARSALAKFKKKGITNIDVGCLQINLAYHGKNFNSLDEVLNPINNVAYGASFITHLREREHSWTRAVKFYHSANRMYHEPYRKKVIKTWQELRQAKMKASGTKTNQVSTFNTSKGYKKQKQAEVLARTKVGVSSY